MACILAICLLAGCGGGDDGEASVPTIVFLTDSAGKQLPISRDMAAEFEAENNCKVEFRLGPSSATERLGEYQKFFTARSDSIDVYQIDVIWPGLLGHHLVEIGEAIDPDDFFPAMIENNTVDGRLVAVPFFADAGLLYYRSDLLEKYGFNAPPQTAMDLEEMARTIQQAERSAGNPNFWGIVFQGAAYEGLTCNALEWQFGADGGTLLMSDGEIVLNNEAARTAFAQVAGWIGKIAPPGVLTYDEEKSRAIFQNGNAAFMRNWPYAYSLGNEEGSAIAGKFDVAPYPGRKHPAGTLGGWSLGVSRYSRNQELAKKFVAFLCSRKAQTRRAVEGGYLATREDVYQLPEVADAMPYYSMMRNVFENAVARPASSAGRAYNEISAAYFQAVHDILAGKSNPESRLAEAEERIQEILERQ